jgi:HlyD family secretion protein
MRKRLLILVPLVIVLASAGWFGYEHFFRKRNHGLEIYGNVDIRQVNLAFRVGGRVAEVKHEEGDTVRPGELVAELDKGPYQDQVNIARAQFQQAEANFERVRNGFRAEEIDQARAQVALAKANVANANLTFARQNSLAQTKVISKQELDNAVAQRDTNDAQLKSAEANLALELAGNRREDIDAARAQAENARANLQNAERNLADCELVAPTEGVVITRAVEPGTIVNVGTTVQVVALHQPIWIRTYIDAIDLGRIYPGMKALVFTDTNPGKPYPAQVGFISPVAEFTPKTVQTRELRTDLVFRLRVIINQPDRYLRQGMPVTVQLIDSPEHHEDVGKPN